VWFGDEFAELHKIVDRLGEFSIPCALPLPIPFLGIDDLLAAVCAFE
jgi:hypothetical protein